MDASRPDDLSAGVFDRGETRAPVRPLTKRELQVLQLLADGLDNRDVGAVLSLTEETVKSHVRNILAKLDAPNRAAAVAVALRHRVIT